MLECQRQFSLSPLPLEQALSSTNPGQVRRARMQIAAKLKAIYPTGEPLAATEAVALVVVIINRLRDSSHLV